MLYIRPLTVRDDFNRYMECVSELNGAGIDVCSPEQMKRSLITRPNNIVTYVITIDDVIVATATCLFEQKLRYNQLCCHIEDVGVHPDFRKNGYGKMIVDHCIHMAKAKRCYKVKLFCADHLLSFYSGMGFKRHNNGMEKVLTKIV